MIRKGRLTDIDELKNRFIYAKGININSFRSKYMYVVENKGKIIAFLHGDRLQNVNSAILLGLEVIEEYRHQKIATSLLKVFENDLKEENCEAILVFCNNTNGELEFYRKVGFKTEDTLYASLKEI